MYHDYQEVRLKNPATGQQILEAIRLVTERGKGRRFAHGEFTYNTFRCSGGWGQNSNAPAECFVVMSFFDRGRPQGSIQHETVYHEVVVANTEWTNDPELETASADEHAQALQSYINAFTRTLASVLKAR